MIDFDKLFENYIKSKLSELKGLTEDEMEDKIPNMYEEWCKTPLAELGGKSPKAYFDGINDADTLISMLKESGEDSCELLIDRIIEADTAEDLYALAESDENPHLAALAINILSDKKARHPLDKYAERIFDTGADETLREIGIEILKENADFVADKLFPFIEKADRAQKEMLAEILVGAKKDERTFKLLCDEFTGGGSVPIYASYLAKYGDERAAALLYKALDSCDYADFIEVRNAIEELGGTVDDNYRDFEGDKTYQILKGGQKLN